MTATGSRRRHALVVLGTLVALLFTATVAGAKTFEVSYDWNDARYGFQGWRVDNAPPTDAGGVPWYSSTKTTRQGLKIVPLGGARPYRAARGTWAWDPPAGATIRRARIEGLDGKAIQRQFARAWLVVDGEPPEARSNLKELGYAGTGLPSATWMNRGYTLITPAGKNGVGFVLWLYTIPCESIDEPSPCVPVGPSDDASVSLRKAVFTVDDPSKATMDVSGLPQSTTWTRDRQVRLRIASSDPQSGVGKVEATVRGGGDSRTLGLGRWTPDRFNTADRAPGEPPLNATCSVDRTVSVARTGTTRLTLRTTNGAGMTTTSVGQVRVDRDRPDVTWPRKTGAGDPVRVADRPSGVESATLTVNGRERDRCSDARSCRLRVPSDVSDRARVAVKVVDRAGNERSGTRTVRVTGVAKDHRSPKIAWPRTVKAGSPATVTDDASGIADATLATLDPTVDADRCGGGQRRCKVQIPKDAAGKQVRVIAFDRAGNRTSSMRKVLKRTCRPRSTCPGPGKPAKSGFLTYPADNADLWAGPLRFRWARPSVKGLPARAGLWYRVDLDGDEIYAGSDLEHDEFGIPIEDHRWTVRAYKSKSSRSPLRVQTSGFRMVEYGGPVGGPTDTDDSADDGVDRAAATRGLRVLGAQRPTRVSANGKNAKDLGVRFAPRLKMDGGERWRPLSVDEFLSENNQQMCTGREDARRCTSRGRIPSSTLTAASNGGRYLDIGKPGTQDDDTYIAHRPCGIYGEEKFECRADQRIYSAIRYTNERGGLYAIEYWWFFRYNDGNSKDCSGPGADVFCKPAGELAEIGTGKRIGDHEGDWEGITVYVDRDGKRIRDIAYRQHGKSVHYGSARWRGTTGRPGNKQGRPNVYLAKGRHGAYPEPGTGLDTKSNRGDKFDKFIALGEVYDGKTDWSWNDRVRSKQCPTSKPGRASDVRFACLERYPVRARKYLNEGLEPTGPWAAYQGPWGGSYDKGKGAAGQEPSPEGPGFGTGPNRSDFREPFDLRSLKGPTRPKPGDPRAAGLGDQEPIVSEAPCGSWFGDGVTALACGSDDGAGAGFDVVHPGGTVETENAEPTVLGPGWISQRVGSALEGGDTLRLRDPADGARTFMLRIVGEDGQPYVTTVEVPAGTGWLDVELRVVSTNDGVSLAGLPAAWSQSTIPGVSTSPSATAYLHAEGDRGVIFTAGRDVRALRLKALTKSGRRAAVRFTGRAPSASPDGYQRWTVQLPKGTVLVAGEADAGGRASPVPVYLRADVSVYRAVRAPRPSPTAPGDGAGRPTK